MAAELVSLEPSGGAMPFANPQPAGKWVMTGELQHRDVAPQVIRTMLREASRSNGARRLLRWLAGHLDGWVVLLGPGGEPWYDLPRPPEELWADAADVIGSVTAGRRRSAAADVGGYLMWVLEINTDATLVVVGRGRFPGETGTVVADAASLLRLRWQAERADRRHREVVRAESFAREAVLHLIMVGQLDGARRAAGALQQQLPDLLRVYLIESPAAGRRDEAARLCAEVSGRRAWIIPCPVYATHLVVLAQVGGGPADSVLDKALGKLATDTAELYVGVGLPVPLRETPTGYEQAFHALAVARNCPARFTVFGAQTELAELIGPAGKAWVSTVLAPLLSFTPERAQDPDTAELIATLRAWLTFYGRATGQLKIHRNTLATRLRRIEHILGYELGDLGNQAKLHLALRLIPYRSASGASGQSCIEQLLSAEPVRQWARTLLSPLLEREPLLATLRAWLGSNGRLDATATALGLSVPGARKRLMRIEELLGRSLLNAPSVRCDLLIALRIHDGDAAF
ncbi:MAG TPA: helix-turn-helix domain-containing protein [Amycolatopsis sp.]|uniref:helix-turn-helix domain-containing protein n=1 Tax=Amycolatopsis sp. TaxID=37632 RepID=UPI002B47927A|nr:helix-turn-helix domain-containing protein [Amycolatopsis sp.]HKS46925.1 helix-turn-helix domain-containing protein [Amycolatopsis sp.]